MPWFADHVKCQDCQESCRNAKSLHKRLLAAIQSCRMLPFSAVLALPQWIRIRSWLQQNPTKKSGGDRNIHLAASQTSPIVPHCHSQHPSHHIFWKFTFSSWYITSHNICHIYKCWLLGSHAFLPFFLHAVHVCTCHNLIDLKLETLLLFVAQQGRSETAHLQPWQDCWRYQSR